MNTLIIEHVSPKVLPSEWVRRLHLLPEQTVTVRIETDADTVSAEQGGEFATDDPAFGIWRDFAATADVEHYWIAHNGL